MFQVAARIYDEGGGIGCLDPRKIAYRLVQAFPGEAVVCLHDYAWKDYDSFKQRSVLEGASDTLEAVMRVAERDAHRRGPLLAFRLHAGRHQVILGRAERYNVMIWSEQPIPSGLRGRFIAFLRSLTFDPFEITSEGDDTDGATSA